jgi:hypothetical protein
VLTTCKRGQFGRRFVRSIQSEFLNRVILWQGATCDRTNQEAMAHYRQTELCVAFDQVD